MSTHPKPKAFIDGGCPICSAEVAFLQKKGANIEFVDLTDPSCDLHEDVKQTRLSMMHVQDIDGRMYQGAQAFSLMYQHTPGFFLLGRLLGLPIIRHGADIFYRCFLWVRPLWRPKNRP
jgi:predicted DCC family thiol-disulfide oxidoreductase YuxK